MLLAVVSISDIVVGRSRLTTVCVPAKVYSDTLAALVPKQLNVQACARIRLCKRGACGMGMRSRRIENDHDDDDELFLTDRISIEWWLSLAVRDSEWHGPHATHALWVLYNIIASCV